MGLIDDKSPKPSRTTISIADRRQSQRHVEMPQCEGAVVDDPEASIVPEVVANLFVDLA